MCTKLKKSNEGTVQFSMPMIFAANEYMTSVLGRSSLQLIKTLSLS